MIKQIDTIENFNNELNNIDNRYIIVYFYTSTCNPCKMISSQLDTINAELDDDILILKINAEESSDLTSMFSIMSVPTLIYFNNGEMVNQTIGFLPIEEIKSKLFIH